MRVAIMQPTYLPWMGFFDLIDRVDTFIILDDVQFEKQSWQQRNYIKGPAGKILLSVPVQRTGLNTLIQDARINTQTGWQKKHLQSILQCYSKAPHIDDVAGWLTEIYEQPWDSLLALNGAIIQSICASMSLSTPIVFSSDYAVEGAKVEKVLRLCAALKADTYLSPLVSYGYINEDNRFSEQGITLQYQNFAHPTYVQLNGDFISHLSVIDLLLNQGKESINILRSGQREPYTHEVLTECVSRGDPITTYLGLR